MGRGPGLRLVLVLAATSLALIGLTGCALSGPSTVSLEIAVSAEACPEPGACSTVGLIGYLVTVTVVDSTYSVRTGDGGMVELEDLPASGDYQIELDGGIQESGVLPPEGVQTHSFDIGVLTS